MKRILILFIAVVSVFCLGSAALAEGFKLDVDLTYATPNEDYHAYDEGILALGGECDLGTFVLGGSVFCAVYRDPEFEAIEDGLTYMYGVYGGFKILDDEAVSLMALVGYYDLAQYYTTSEVPGGMEIDWNDTAVAVGLKAAANLAPVTLSFTYLYGVSVESTLDIITLTPPPTFESADPGFTYLEVKGSFAVSESCALYLVYRNFNFVGVDIDSTPLDDQDFGYSGFGVGVEFGF